jgi:tryptophan synthase alpha subunit
MILIKIYLKYGIKKYFLITPQTSVERIHFIDSVSDAFIYMVGSEGVTGSIWFGATQRAYFKQIADYRFEKSTSYWFLESIPKLLIQESHTIC